MRSFVVEFRLVYFYRDIFDYIVIFLRNICWYFVEFRFYGN